MSGAPIDSVVSFRIVGGGTAAIASIPASADPASLDLKAAVALATTLGIKVDAKVAARLNDVVEAFKASPHETEETVAEAVPAMHGEDGRLEWVDQYSPEGAGSVVRDEASACLDHYNRVSYVQVGVGAHVATLIPPTSGTDGIDVSGETIKARPGTACTTKIDATFAVDDGGRVTAAVGGLLDYRIDLLQVTRLFEVDGTVDFTTGNVRHDGSVIVKEGVRGRFAVVATENVLVKGLIEAADIDCGGNFVCPQGMAAKDRGQVRIGGDADVGYFNGVKGLIGGDLAVQRELIGCRLVVTGEVTGENAAVIGGNLSINGRVDVAQLGAAGRPTTTLLFGDDLRVSGQLHRLQLHMEELEAQLEAARSGTASGAHPPAADLRQRLDACRNRLAELEEARRQSAMASRVDLTVRRVIHPEVRLLRGDREVVFEQAVVGAVRITWLGDEEPLIAIGGDEPVPLAVHASVLPAAA